MLEELFQAESKTQVYAHLYKFLSQHPPVSRSTGKLKKNC